MSISEAHRKLGYIAHSAIRHAISNELIAGIELDNDSKPEFCDACAKAKSTHQPFPKNLKPGWKSLANAFTGIFGDLPLSKALMDTVMWPHESMMPPGKQNCIFKKRKVSFSSHTKWMRPTLKPKLGKELRYLAQIKRENLNLHLLSTIRIKEEQYESLLI